MFNCFLVNLMQMRPRKSEGGSDTRLYSTCRQSHTLDSLRRECLLTDTNLSIDIVTNANEERLNVMEIHHVKDAETSTSSVNMLRIVVPMASRNRRSFVE